MKLYAGIKGQKLYQGDMIHLKSKKGVWTIKEILFRDKYLVVGYSKHKQGDFFIPYEDFKCRHKRHTKHLKR